jgi:hypothetical protein
MSEKPISPLRRRMIEDMTGAIDLQARVAVYREAGWTSHDPNAEPYTPEEMERERKRHAPR